MILEALVGVAVVVVGVVGVGVVEGEEEEVEGGRGISNSISRSSISSRGIVITRMMVVEEVECRQSDG